MIAVANAQYELDAGAGPNAAIPGLTALHIVIGVRKSGLGDNDPSPDGSVGMTGIEFVREMAAITTGGNANPDQVVTATALARTLANSTATATVTSPPTSH